MQRWFLALKCEADNPFCGLDERIITHNNTGKFAFILTFYKHSVLSSKFSPARASREFHQASDVFRDLLSNYNHTDTYLVRAGLTNVNILNVLFGKRGYFDSIMFYK